MQYAKDTNSVKPGNRRWYNDACGTAFALELVGERWALLVMRELLFGPRRFGDLRATLKGITPKVLTERLERLVSAGIVVRRKLPPPASVQVYELTAWGYRSDRAIMELGRWATASPDHDPTLPLSAAGLMLSFRTMFDAARAQGIDARIGFRFGDENFVAEIGERGLTIVRGEPIDVGVLIASTPSAVAKTVYAGLPLAGALTDGSIELSGDLGLAERFVGLFPLVRDDRASP